jgi:hypothetical protein
MNILKLCTIIILGGITAACQSSPQVQVPQLSFNHLPAISLGVGQKAVSSTYAMPLKEPNVEHRMATSPEKAFKLWVSQRVATRGQGGVANFILEDASVVEVPLARTKGVKGLFTKDQSERYEATLKAAVELFDPSGKKLGYASAKVKHTRTVGESITLNEREQIWFEMVEALMKDFDRTFEANIRTHLGAWAQ